MFSQVNSEATAATKTFNASLDHRRERQPKSLFEMIKNTYEKSPAGVLSAYSDNARSDHWWRWWSLLPDAAPGPTSITRKRFIGR